MELPISKGPVAKWTFENGPINKLSWPNLEKSLVNLEQVASVLKSQDLLNPNTICLSKWMIAGSHQVVNSNRVEKPTITFSFNSLNSYPELILQCRSLIEEESVYPLTINLLGSGMIKGEVKNFDVDNLIWISCTTLEIFRISIMTQSDVWLPFALDGKPHEKTFKLNEDRLTNALSEIQLLTGFKLEEGQECDYSIINGFRIENIRYSDGSIANVL
ncbi:MAG: hypothetical protein H6574_18885 [Lewinellaceae bacterium]|nr:hypothetical protein [Lewinellaceae bacterium]MCB9333139.1 hypothetical protein [Lewinellaceae bacterium]